MAHPQLFKKIFENFDAEGDTVAGIHTITNQYPYFGLAQLYALRRTSNKDAAYDKTAARTALFFSNSFFLQTQLHKLGEESDVVIQEIDVVEPQHIEKISDVEHNVEKEEILFEPLHASDYFASQGIKLSEDALGTDKLGKQLKSFTAWLKTMKKVHPDKLPAVNKTTETAVQNQAEKSNIEEEIVTEPMAEAYILQNKQAKAIEIYNKLSLLNPAKNAYFAAKIDSLKN